MGDNPRETVLASVKAHIAEYGWSVVAVGPTVDDPPGTPGFAYTVGLTELDHPEIIVFGLGYETMHDLLNSLGTRVRRGERFVAGAVYEDIVQPGSEGRVFDVTFREVEPTGWLNVATSLYPSMTAIQMLWPDPENRLPYHPDFSGSLRHLQPLLPEGQ